ncbi:MAG: VC0807 family protein [Thermomicrobiales bacterium]
MLSLLFNVLIPTIIMIRFSGEDQLGGVGAMLVALAFPFFFGIYNIFREKKIGWVPILGIVSIMLSGGFNLLKFPAEWIAFKEASIPLVLALAILVSAWINRPLARLFLNQLLDREVVDKALHERGMYDQYEKRTAMATYLLAFAFLLSAVLNFILARVIVTSDPQTPEYTQEIGRMTGLSFPVITIPVMVVLMGTVIYIMMTVSKLTGLEAEQVLRQPGGKKKDESDTPKEAEPAQ